MKNLLEPSDKEYCNILTNIEGSKEQTKTNIEELPMITLKMHYNLVNGLTLFNKWKVFEQYEIKVVPLVIRMTEEIYNFYYEYVFASQQTDPNIGENMKSKNSQFSKNKIENLSSEKLNEPKKKVNDKILLNQYICKGSRG